MKNEMVKYKLIDEKGFIDNNPYNLTVLTDYMVNKVAEGFISNSCLVIKGGRLISGDELRTYFKELGTHQQEPRVSKKLDIPWGYISEKYKFCAMDSDKDIWVYTELPKKSRYGVWTCSCIHMKISEVLKIDTKGVIWEESLCERK